MNKGLLSAGIVIIILGLFLALAFWPMVAVRGRGLSAADHDAGDKVTVYGTITRITSMGIVEFIQLDGELEIVNDGERTNRKEGDVVYCELRLSSLNIWMLNGDIRLKRNIDIPFYLISILGVGISAAGAVKT